MVNEALLTERAARTSTMKPARSSAKAIEEMAESEIARAVTPSNREEVPTEFAMPNRFERIYCLYMAWAARTVP